MMMMMQSAPLFLHRAGHEEEERSGGNKEQSETENDLGQTRYHRRDVKLADFEMEAVVSASVRSAGSSGYFAQNFTVFSLFRVKP